MPSFRFTWLLGGVLVTIIVGFVPVSDVLQIHYPPKSLEMQEQ